MRVVITHIQPDFDALASAYGALKLHNCEHIAMITNSEPNVYDFIKSSFSNIPIKRYSEKDIDNILSIDLLVITDCKQKKRLGKLSQLLDKSKEIIIYDHHPDYKKDIENATYISLNYGSSTSIVVKKIIENNIDIMPLEATFFGLGVYEDTGLLTFESTKYEDIEVVGWLLKKGMKTSIISDFVKRDLNRSQVFILNELLLNLSIITISGVNVALSYATSDEYIDEVSYIVQRLMVMEGLECFFSLISTGGRIILVCRSKTPKVDVSLIAAQFGGGGHIGAASAIIKDLFLPEAIEKLKYTIRESIRPVKTVSELMNSPVKYVKSNTTFKKAMAITMKYNLNNMPVVKDDKTIGIISRRDIIDGIKHNLNNEPINDIMQVEFDIVSPETPFYLAEEIMICKGQKLLPVEDNNKLVGVITRTDLLRLMHEEYILQNEEAIKGRNFLGISRKRNLKGRLLESLPKKIVSILDDIGKLAETENMQAFVVGGFVRDLLMKNENFDIDIVIEGDARKFACRYAEVKGGKASIHEKFKTAVVVLPDGFKIDFATARTEYYMTPAAAPEVEEASIRNDLYRRDFTINAMAIRLDGKNYGLLLDFFSGQKDINEKKIRALHSLSFVDDPSRAFRAIRFAVRFDFSIGSHTERLIKHAESLNLFGQIVGQRLFLELKYILDEQKYMKAFELMKKYNLLRFFCDKFQIDEFTKEKFVRLEQLVSWYRFQIKNDIDLWRSRFILFFYTLNFNDYKDMLNRFNQSEKLMDMLLKDYGSVYNILNEIKKEKDLKPSKIVKICSVASPEVLLVVASIVGEEKQFIIKNFLTDYSKVEPLLNGDDLKLLGLKRGPQFKEVLEKLKNARLDGLVKDKGDEEGFVLGYISNLPKED